MRDAGLVRRWSRRDWLSAAVVATTAAFLVGTALLLTSAGAYTSTLEGGLATSATVEYTESPATVTSEGDRIVVPVSPATVDGTDTRVVGVPSDAPAEIPGASVAWKAARLPQPTANTAVGPVAYRHEVVIEGTAGTVTRDVRPPENRSVFPARWYADRPSTTEELGTSGAFVLDPGSDDGDASYRTGVPLIGTIPFILLGIRDVLRILSLAGVAGGVVVLVVVYSVTRMSVRDRRTTVRVLRATGADPLRVGGLIAARAAAVTGVGVGAGVLAGVAAPPAIVAAAGALGVPVTLPTEPTPEKLRVVGALAATLTLA
ncbi:ABC transporter permease, partial [Halobaculum sp. WSA2]